MFLTISQICDWGGANPSERKFVEGERLLKAGHIIKCGKNIETDGTIALTALCLQTTNMRLMPHAIKAKFNSKGITSCTCSCKAGLGGKCKHIIAVLLYCHQNNDKIEELSCTDKQCEWKKKHKQILHNYDPAPLSHHKCFSPSQPAKNVKIIDSASNLIQEKDKQTEETEEEIGESHLKPDGAYHPDAERKKKVVALSLVEEAAIRNIICKDLPASALAKHMFGRHTLVSTEENNHVNSTETKIIQIIFQFQNSELMTEVHKLPVCAIQECCINMINKLGENAEEICMNTKHWYASWIQERSYRITGSICYELFTYTKNKNADWNKKCDNILKPKNFKTEFTEYGKKTEAEARRVFTKAVNGEVIETGLIISKLNPWLAYSPDGIIFKDDKPVALLEIKCPFVGKTANIETTVNSQINKCLHIKQENITLKENHRYYGQVQLGMAVLNLKLTHFVIYSSFDQQCFTLNVERNDDFIVLMLHELKRVYYSVMLPKVCAMKNKCDKDSQVRHNN